MRNPTGIKRAAFAAFLIFTAMVFSLGISAEVIGVPCIMYHSVKPSPDSEFSISPSVFEADMYYLKRHGYETISLGELASRVAGGKPIPERSVLITFDDGYSDVLYNALPILNKYGYRAVMAVTVSSIGKNFSTFPHMTEYELKIMKNSGIFELANHSYDLHKLDDRVGSSIKPGEAVGEYRKILTRDLSTAFDALSRLGVVNVKAYAYPYCAVSDESVAVLEALGVEAALTGEVLPQGAEQSDVLFIRRICRNGTHTTERFFRYFDKVFGRAEKSSN